jgi:hypothetical protein
VKWMTAPETACSQQASAQCPVLFDGLVGVMRTTRVKSALVADEWAQGNLIATNDELQGAARSIAQIVVQIHERAPASVLAGSVAGSIKGASRRARCSLSSELSSSAIT